MAITLEQITLQPNPIPAGYTGIVRALCVVASDSPVKAVTAYLPDGLSHTFKAVDDHTFVAESSTVDEVPSGTYQASIVATNEAGEMARAFVSITVSG